VNLAGDTDQSSEKAVAQFLLRGAQSGDTIVFTGLSRPAVDYYFARADAQSRFVEINFPSDPPYPALPNMGERPRPARLQADAACIAGRLRTSAFGAGHVWLLYGYDQTTASPILKAELDRHLVYRATATGVGPSYTSILEYVAGRESTARLPGR
jgi:hypothetical protein